MENKVDLKKLWSRQPVPEADQAGIFKKIDQFKRSGLRKTLLGNGILALTILIIVLIWIYFQPQLLTTKIGIVLTILAIAMVIFYNGQIIPLYKKADDSRSNLGYLNTLLEIQTRSYYIQTRIMSLYFILLSVGMALYFYEYTVRMPLVWGVAMYAAVFIWFGFAYVVLRPRIIKKSRLKMEDLINELEKVKEQLGEE